MNEIRHKVRRYCERRIPYGNDIYQLEDLLFHATDGPWKLHEGAVYGLREKVATPKLLADAAFIVAAYNRIPNLLEERRELYKLVVKMQLILFVVNILFILIVVSKVL
jgi:hypothetical protein